MRIFVAGAAGAIGRQLVPQLVAAGHQVTGTTRSVERATWLRSAGAEASIIDAFDADAVREAVALARPDAVIHELTDLAAGFDTEQLRANSRIREVGTRHIVEAMVQAGIRRLISQSGAWLYASGQAPHDEDDPLRDPALHPDDVVLPGILELERLTVQTPGVGGIVLRYGFFYGPGTSHLDVPEPPLDPGVHVVAAARATVLAIELGAPGVYNVVDDGGSVSNRRAREELGWVPGLGS